jgi:Cd2+/Zn2+-exporting ATPase
VALTDKAQTSYSCCDHKRANRWTSILIGLSGLLAGIAEAIAWQTQNEHSIAIILISLVSIALSGKDTLVNGLKALVRFDLSINFLMSIAIIGAALLGSWPESAMVCFLFTIAEAVEDKASDHARKSIGKLMDIAPQTATIRNQEGEWQEHPTREVQIGQIGLIHPGERIPFDGTVVKGESSIDQSPITGESVPVDKVPGDKVYAGTINYHGAIEYEITADEQHTTLARIIHAVEEAQSHKAPTQRFVDAFARIYTPIVVALAILIACVPPLFLGASFSDWIYRSLVLLVISCPCALVLSTPVTVVSGLAKAAQMGILVKGGVHLENGRHLKVVALDKTGTLTHGKPVVTDVVPLNGLAPERVRQIAASLNSLSEHPIGKAIRSSWTGETAPLDDFSALPGRGVRGTVEGRTYYLGNHRLIEDLNVCGEHVESELLPMEADGKTAVVLASEREALGVFAISDAIKETSIEAIRRLHRMGIRTAMLSGDNEPTAIAIGRKVGIDDIRSELLPEDKLVEIVSLKHQGRVAMVGDGINDAPALATADIGISMGVMGTDVAMEAADVALMDDDLRKIPTFLEISRKTSLVLTQNILIAIGVKVIFFILAFTGYATLWMAVFADMGGSLLVIANGLRLLGRIRHNAVS